MTNQLISAFCWRQPRQAIGQDAVQEYQHIIDWAGQARGKNPDAFDALTQWLLDNTQWGDDVLVQNRKILMEDIIHRFQKQNLQLREDLMKLRNSIEVNPAVFPALDRFDDELSGKPHDKALQQAVSLMFSDFSAMHSNDLRKTIAGGATGPSGTDSVDFFGYINYLKSCDAAVQWALFMPQAVTQQQKGFHISHFSCHKLPAMRFIGKETTGESDIPLRKEVFTALDALKDYCCGFNHDLFLMHHYGLGVDVGPWHGFWGRFMKADTPVPEGFLFFDFIPRQNGQAGPPYLSQFTYAVFSGDMEAMHQREGYDSDAMYDVTRNTMLAQGIHIPYPDKYWTAEVFLNGWEYGGTAYLFSAELEE
jgi:hypothetical protein